MLGKKDFIDRLAEKGYTKADAAIICHDFLLTLEEIFVEKESICFKKFGTFHCKKRKSRVLNDIHTGEEIISATKDYIHFSMGNVLKKEMLSGELDRMDGR